MGGPTLVDLSFTVTATGTIPSDHGYRLYSGLSRLLAEIHSRNGIGIHPIRGRQAGDRSISILPTSRLVIRTSVDHIPAIIQLSGKALDLAGCNLRVGVPQVLSLTPSTALRSRLVTIKLSGELTSDEFHAAVRRQLDQLEVSTQAIITFGKRRTLRIKDKEVVGYEILIEGLTAEESLNIQEQGIGGRRHMGCGVFVALQ